MSTLTLPDGAQRHYDRPPTGSEVARSISPGLARKAAAVLVDGRVRDLERPIDTDARVEILTRDDPRALEVLRHDAAHVLAQAVQELFPGTQVTFGPATEQGFYYDFVREEPFSDADLERIEARMREIVKRDLPIRREVWDREQAIAHFEGAGETYKAEWIRDGIAPDAEISVYRQGDWLDLCAGPHLPSTGRLGQAFKLLHVSGAYWRGDARNAQLQRIHGTAFADQAALDAHFKQLEEAERRDHRKLGRRLDLFHFQDEAPGAVFWHPKGWTLFQQLIAYMRERNAAAGYVEVNTPELMDRSLWERSGHWANYAEHMFTTERDEDRVLCLKPMNCPGHVQIYNQGLRSYRELPLRLAEFGKVHRYEPSGALHGLLRVRSFTQDDAHIFCTPEQLHAECVAVCELVLGVYRDFGFEDVHVKLSTRPDKRIGEDALWGRAEDALRAALESLGVKWTLFPGEGAFYGPKIEFVLRDAIGREWQCGTLQADFNLPGRLDAEYVGETGARHRPVMLHRAVLGSLERFTGVLIEHHAGALPVWLAPIQAMVLTITERHNAFAAAVAQRLCTAGVRAEADLRNEKVGYKIREHSLARVPYLLVVGDRERDSDAVAVRTRAGADLGTMQVQAFIARIAAEIAGRGHSVMED
jgi:threonyl-tRNA synthetase